MKIVLIKSLRNSERRNKGNFTSKSKEVYKKYYIIFIVINLFFMSN